MRLFVLAALAALAVLRAVGVPPPAAAAAAERPSIVLVLTDDMEAGLVNHMPNVRRHIVERGATFTRAYFNDPLCCPSRATILTGRYAQNTGVTVNSHPQFVAGGNEERTFAVWLRAAGYRTALVGKYLNGYPSPSPAPYIPPGWDRWFAYLDGGAYWGTLVADQTGTRAHGPNDYATDVYRRRAVAFIQAALADGAPYLLLLAPPAPHNPAIPAPRHNSLFPGLKAPMPPSFNEADVSDKPAYIRDETRLSAASVVSLHARHRKRARSLQAVDEAVGEIVAVLEAAGRLGDTYLVMTTDNGWLHGIHRITDKGPPHEEGTRMALHVAGPGIAPGSTVDRLVGNVDLAPTFAEWAGATAPDDLDGRSLAPLLCGAGPAAWRRAFPLFYDLPATKPWPAWRGVRTRDRLYAEYATGERELYDTVRDPWQLHNLASPLAQRSTAERRYGAADSKLLARLSALTAALAGCAGARCRELEDGWNGP